jgi:hypothetical protein
MALDTQRRQQLIDRMALRIADLRLTAPAILFLEMNKPLAFLGAQFLLALQPFLNIGMKDTDLRDLALLLEDRQGVDDLIDRLESIRSEQPSAPQLHHRT